MRPTRPTRSSIHLARAFSALLVIATLAALAVYWMNRLAGYERLQEATLQDIEHRASALTSALAEQTRSVIYNLDLGLLHLQHQHLHKGRADDDDMKTVLAATPAGLVRRVSLIDASGAIQRAYPPLPGKPVGLADRPYFEFHARPRGNAMYIGTPIRSRFSDEWLIPVSRPLRDAHGRFEGVAMMTVAPEYFAEIYGRLAAGREDAVALVHRDGSFMSRSLNLLDHLGKSVRADRPYVGEHSERSGVFRSFSSHEPVDRVFAWRRLDEWPLVVVIGLGVRESLAPLQAGRSKDLAATAGVSAMVLALVAGVVLVLLRLSRSVVQLGEAEERLGMAFAGASELAWEWNVGSRSVVFFGDCRALFGHDARELRLDLQDWASRFHPDERAEIRRLTLQLLKQQGAGIEFHARVQHVDGSRRWMLLRGRTVQRNPAGGVERLIGILLDVDDSRRAALQAAQTRERYASLVEHAGEGIFVVDGDGRIELFNPTAERLLGITAAEAHGLQASELMLASQTAGEPMRLPACPVMQTLADGVPRRGERVNYRHRDGHAVPVELSVAPTRIDGNMTGAVVVIADIASRLAWEAQMESLARTDTLTGIANRRHFVEQCEREFARADRDGTALSLLMLDIDHFKTLNDRYGHAAGDAVLAAVAQCCNDILRQIDIFGRLGGEEFGAALPGASAADARGVAERLRESIASLVVESQGHDLRCTVSIGVATRHAQEGFDGVLARADSLLYAAKGGGRNRVIDDEPLLLEGSASDASAELSARVG